MWCKKFGMLIRGVAFSSPKSPLRHIRRRGLRRGHCPFAQGRLREANNQQPTPNPRRRKSCRSSPLSKSLLSRSPSMGLAIDVCPSCIKWVMPAIRFVSQHRHSQPQNVCGLRRRIANAHSTTTMVRSGNRHIPGPIQAAVAALAARS